MLIVFIRAVILYLVIIFSVRLMGKRQIGELQPSELVVTILVSNIATLPVEDISIPMSMGIVPILTLVCLDVIMSALTLKSRKIRRIVSGSPKIVIDNGRINTTLLKELRFSNDDLLEGLRSQGVFDPDDVQTAVVETTGQITVCLKSSRQPPTCEDIKIQKPDQSPPVMIVDESVVLERAVRALGFDRNWLQKKLKEEGVSLKDVSLMTADRQG
ncbi:MAG: DUF421 domain-containing protein, partial [Ruminococcus sp.]|nr:DUF421 domain-containing protein [Ruminococcus sp.]